MNERFRSLLDRAEYQVGKQYGPDWEVYVEPSREQILQKFAELIVRECAEIADKGWAAPGIQILQHFGVEE